MATGLPAGAALPSAAYAAGPMAAARREVKSLKLALRISRFARFSRLYPSGLFGGADRYVIL
jgi:hypothetical protein